CWANSVASFSQQRAASSSNSPRGCLLAEKASSTQNLLRDCHILSGAVVSEAVNSFASTNISKSDSDGYGFDCRARNCKSSLPVLTAEKSQTSSLNDRAVVAMRKAGKSWLLGTDVCRSLRRAAIALCFKRDSVTAEVEGMTFRIRRVRERASSRAHVRMHAVTTTPPSSDPFEPSDSHRSPTIDEEEEFNNPTAASGKRGLMKPKRMCSVGDIVDAGALTIPTPNGRHLLALTCYSNYS
uniref:CG-1 domain-containing protein n=1 Tax=Macrostomum lignano TaxID=282301 RepID=A0A1I8F5X7_9PLAT